MSKDSSTQNIPQETTKLKKLAKVTARYGKWKNLKTQTIILDISVIIAYTLQRLYFAYNAGVASQTILPKIHSVSKISRLDVYGNPSEELQKVLRSIGPQTYNLFAGFSR
jgi:hypothetical protein